VKRRPALAVLALALAASGCRARPPRALVAHIRLLDLARRGTVSSHGQAPRVADVQIGNDRRTSLVLAGPGSWTFHLAVPPAAHLRFAWDVDGPPVTLRIGTREGSGSRPLVTEAWSGGRGWSERSVDLASLAGRAGDFEVAVDGRATVSLAAPEIVIPAQDDAPSLVIVYVVDCLRADHVGAYGYPRPTTPEIDRMAREGVVFERVQACASWTKPAVGCLFTSRYPVDHGAETVDDPLDGSVPTLAEVFRARGYATATWLANPIVADAAAGLTRGFDRVVELAGNPDRLGINSIEADAAQITDGVLPWLQQNAGRRVFVYLHSLDLHYPYQPRGPFKKLFVSPDRLGDARQVDLYDNEIAYNDAEIGRLLDGLRQAGTYDAALLAVSADHGEEFAEHGFVHHGRSLYDASLHVPFVVKLPGQRHAGARVSALASQIDVPATLADLAGAGAVPGFEGVSFRPLLASGGAPPRTVLFSEQLSPQDVLYAARTDRFKAVTRLVPRPEAFLFDLRDDPRETRNLLPAVPEGARGVLTDLKRFLARGQEGYHLIVSSSRPGAVVEVVATADGANIIGLERFGIGIGERLSLAENHHRAEYRFPGPKPRHLLLRTAPSGAPVTWRLSIDGRPLATSAIVLGKDRLRPPQVPFVGEGAAMSISVEQIADALVPGAAQARLWYLPPPPGAAARRAKAPLDPETQRQLKALGYLQ